MSLGCRHLLISARSTTRWWIIVHLAARLPTERFLPHLECTPIGSKAPLLSFPLVRYLHPDQLVPVARLISGLLLTSRSRPPIIDVEGVWHGEIMQRGSPKRSRVVVFIMGLLLSISANGCMVAQPRKAPILTAIEVATQTNAAIIQFYQWLRQTRQLLRQVPMPPNNPWPKPRQVDPKTLKPIPTPEPLPLKERVEEFLNNHYWDEFASAEML